MRATRAIIHLDNLQYNIEQIRKKLKNGTQICLPVKADAYGHGAVRVAVAAIRAGVSYLAVASIQEAVELREAGIVAPVISLSLPVLEEIPQLLEYDIQPLVIDEEFINELNRAASAMNKKAGVHLKIDTGMTRIGCTPGEAVKLAMQIARAENLNLKGVCTHFAVADSTEKENLQYTKKQISLFKTAVTEIKKAGITAGLIHAANSGAVLQYPEAHFDMVRPGILAYGYPPSENLKGLINLKPVMELVTQVVLIKKIEPGTTVSYDRRWTAENATYIATLPIGYADGLIRSLSPGLKVRIGKEFFPVIGRICMDQCMIDLGPTPWVQRWDEVCIFGSSSKETQNNSASSLAKMAGTIPYELTCGINKRVPRIFIDETIQ
ncbi:alanine racemase [Treponema pedis]|uniref:Alanine racemase n=1 Tax=Treponema pedis str. T A4 TaxID=1291379 RepID=S5ZX28_9SPIR|nr:alanine racemase [Treponema pedis]AGT45010.1 alanine racemase [Treponema pedis str. T A4]QSI05624.1 alanine racemase [Treponema pedis]